jgi:hypothetical protein
LLYPAQLPFQHAIWGQSLERHVKTIHLYSVIVQRIHKSLIRGRDMVVTLFVVVCHESHDAAIQAHHATSSDVRRPLVSFFASPMSLVRWVQWNGSRSNQFGTAYCLLAPTRGRIGAEDCTSAATWRVSCWMDCPPCDSPSRRR